MVTEPTDDRIDDRTDDRKRLLARVNALLVGLRRALGWRHDDEARWAAWGLTAPEAQALRVKLRTIADVLHVERATARGRLHGGTRRFATLELQRAWVTERAHRMHEHAEDFIGEVGLSALP